MFLQLLAQDGGGDAADGGVCQALEGGVFVPCAPCRAGESLSALMPVVLPKEGSTSAELYARSWSDTRGNERLVKVSCICVGDENEPMLKDNVYNNRFLNGTSFCVTDKGHPFRFRLMLM